MSNTSQYEQLFEGSPEERDAKKTALVRQALRGHIYQLAEVKDQGIDYLGGLTTVSIANYFATAPTYTQSKFHNPVNTAALALLPDISYRPGYGDSTDIRANYSKYHEIVSAGKMSSETAIRQGKAAEWLVATKLGLTTQVQTVNVDSRVFRDTASQIAHGLNSGIVNELSVTADRVRKAGYVDFLDYLVDANEALEDIADTLFEHGIQPQITPELEPVV